MVKAIFVFVFMLVFASPSLAKKVIMPEVNLSLSKQTVWQREQLFVTLHVISDDVLSRLDSDIFEQDGFTIVAYQQEKEEKNNKLHLRLKWAVFPFMSGAKSQLQLPRIRYRPSSGRPIALKLAPLSLQVKTLPIYVPPTMPVGKVELQSLWENGAIIFSKKLLNWSVSVKSTNVVPQTLPALSRFFQNSKDFQIFPIKKTVLLEKMKQGLEHSQNYQIPIKALSLGRLQLPKVTTQYFNPASGVIEKVSVKSPTVFVINTYVVVLLGVILFSFVVFLWLKIMPIMQLSLKMRSEIKVALQTLKNANNYAQIREALMQYSFAKSGQQNISLDQFVSSCVLSVSDHERMKSLVQELKLAEFSLERDAGKSTEIARGILQILS